MSKSILATFASVTLLTFAAVGTAFAQSGSKPNGTPAPTAVKQPAVAQAPKLIALSFYADWCPGCKELKPKLDSVMKATGEQSCLFVKLDQTDKESRQAEFLLASLGLGELWREHAGKTGFTLLIDSRSKRIVGKLTPNQDADAMKSSLMSLLGA